MTKRRSASTIALEELREILEQAYTCLNQPASTDPVADYAMRVGGASHYVRQARKIIDNALAKPAKDAK